MAAILPRQHMDFKPRAGASSCAPVDTHCELRSECFEVGLRPRTGVDYQWKDDVGYNDDALNTRLSIHWNLT